MEKLSTKEMGLLSVILGDKPKLKAKIFAMIAIESSIEDELVIEEDEFAIEEDEFAIEEYEPTKLIQNAIECHTCGVIIVSTHRHDFVQCLCGNAVDGGLDYIRRIGDLENMTDLILTENDSSELVRKYLVWGTRGINGDQPLDYKRIMDLETSHLEAILRTQSHANPIVRNAITEILNIRINGTKK